MEFMGISVGILALICALVLLFGRQSTRKILGWGFGVLIFGGLCLGVVAWALSSYQQHNAGETTKATMATPLGILSAPPTDGAKSIPTKYSWRGRTTGLLGSPPGLKRLLSRATLKLSMGDRERLVEIVGRKSPALGASTAH
jgi:hypothetical protein